MGIAGKKETYKKKSYTYRKKITYKIVSHNKLNELKNSLG